MFPELPIHGHAAAVSLTSLTSALSAERLDLTETHGTARDAVLCQHIISAETAEHRSRWPDYFLPFFAALSLYIFSSARLLTSVTDISKSGMNSEMPTAMET